MQFDTKIILFLGPFLGPLLRPLLGASLLGLPLLFGCGLDQPKKKVLTECVLPADQTGTLSGHWKVTAIPIALHQGDFSAEEARTIASAADTWNEFYAASLGMAAIDYGGDPNNPRTSAAPKPASICGQGILTGSTYTGSVVIYKQARWTYTSMPDAIALTNFCTVPAKPLPMMFMAIMELNYQNFFVAGKRVPDLKSIVIHEFGHLMGLNHSCEKATKTGIPNCSSTSLDPKYSAAAMYPVFSFTSYGYGQVKQSLNDNDQGRANCLYEGGSTQ